MLEEANKRAKEAAAVHCAKAGLKYYEGALKEEKDTQGRNRVCAEAATKNYEELLKEERQTHALKRVCLLRDSCGEYSSELRDAYYKYCAMYPAI